MISYTKIIPVSKIPEMIRSGEFNKVEIRRDQNSNLNNKELVKCRLFVRDSRHNFLLNFIKADIENYMQSEDSIQEIREKLGGIYSELVQNYCLKSSTFIDLIEIKEKGVQLSLPEKYIKLVNELESS